MTLNQLCKKISENSLFSKGGTFTKDEAKEILKRYKFKYDKGKYKNSPETKQRIQE